MYKKVEGNQRMTAYEASAKFPNDYILMRRDKRVISNPMGTILYLGDDSDELFDLGLTLEDSTLCVVYEGLNHQRSLGGVVVGG